MRRLGLVLVALLLPALLVPAPADAVVSPCPNGWQGGVLVAGRGACLAVEVQNPNALIPNPFLPTTRACDVPGMHGVNTTVWGGAYVMACVEAGATVPNGNCYPVTNCFAVIVEQCGPGIDPTVILLGGAVWVCGALVQNVQKEVPPVFLDLSPCPGGFDPKIAVGNSSVEICLVLFT